MPVQTSKPEHTALEHISGKYPLAKIVDIPGYDAVSENDDMAVLTIIASNGMICRCNRLAALLLNCISGNIVRKNISTVLPQLKHVELIQAARVNPYLRFLSRIDHHFEVLAMNGRFFTSNLYFNEVDDLGQHCLRLIMRPVL